MKLKVLSIEAFVTAFSGCASATGVSMDEFLKVQSINQCAYISNTMSSENTAQVMELALNSYVEITSKSRPGGYHPSPSDLATDYALFFQQTVSDTEDEIFQQIRSRGLPLAPGSWQLVAGEWWTVKQCSMITGL
ncbi:TPA: hypothetical protein U6J11_004736 [Klebsiella pneumoniae]|uniref:hypothetical protein n=1 Tax=Klebsiella pneumoniae TaxID=573 RepID=UPI00240670A1|nr:hypothetical protein [Klebsiella pneumoniae]MDF9949099.1 hypothetical protein [Klebsiella pneumoniae]HEN5200269.1 hypothetical protein [Klebsiella pneumoniae]